jgi:hypothetical protein
MLCDGSRTVGKWKRMSTIGPHEKCRRTSSLQEFRRMHMKSRNLIGWCEVRALTVGKLSGWAATSESRNVFNVAPFSLLIGAYGHKTWTWKYPTTSAARSKSCMILGGVKTGIVSSNPAPSRDVFLLLSYSLLSCIEAYPISSTRCISLHIKTFCNNESKLWNCAMSGVRSDELSSVAWMELFSRSRMSENSFISNKEWFSLEYACNKWDSCINSFSLPSISAGRVWVNFIRICLLFISSVFRDEIIKRLWSIYIYIYI